MNKYSLEGRINKLEKLIKESNYSAFDDDLNNIKDILDEVDDLLTEAVATADDIGNARLSNKLNSIIAAVRRVEIN